MCISYLTFSDVMTRVIITSENSGGVICCKDFMCITSEHSREINFAILAFRMVSAPWFTKTLYIRCFATPALTENYYQPVVHARPRHSSILQPHTVRSAKLQNESSPNFRAEFSPEFSPIYSRIFRALFPRRRRPTAGNFVSLNFRHCLVVK